MHPKVKTAGTSQYESSDDFARIPYLKEWKVARSASEQVPPEANAGGASTVYKDSDCIAFLLTNGTLRLLLVPGEGPSLKVVVCPLMKAVTFIDLKNYDGRTFGIQELSLHGVDVEPYKYINMCSSPCSFTHTQRPELNFFLNNSDRCEIYSLEYGLT